ncbi:MAG: mechanosensitive ion channel domain-containing protein, partial [Bacteroidota bacterium]
WIVAGWAGRLVSKNVAKRIDPTLAGFFGNLTKYTILTLAILAALGVFGVDVTTFAAILAGAGLAIGLALQGTLSNFSAGVMLLAFRPFKVGDFVKVDGQAGVVHEIGLFSTELDTVDNRRVIVPNGNIFGATIENVTYHPIRRVDVNVGTDYSADLKRVRAVLEQAAASVSNQLEDRVPQVFLSDLGDSSINWQVRIWCPTGKYWDVWQETTHTIKRALDDAGIGIPFPQMDVHLDRLDG